MDHTASHIEHVDVLIVGAGISGIGAAYYLQKDHPGRSYAILEARGATGGTWDLFRYPGIRSDSDLHTFGYEFKPWRDEDAIASADKILAYLRETVAENGIDANIRFHHKVLGAAWSSDDARWTVDVERCAGTPSELVQFSANWIFCAGGYYRYDQGYTPEFEGRDRFGGQVVHPQHWPEDLDYTGKKVVIIGSGATAVTLVPAMAGTAGHVTMLQRSPTYVHAGAVEGLLRQHGAEGARRQARLRARPPQEHRSSSVPSTSFCQRFPRRGAAADPPHQRQASCPRAIRSTSTSTPPTTRGISGCARCPTVTCSRRSQRRRLGGHRPHRDLHRDRDPAGVRNAPRRRHHRHRNGFERPAVRRYVADGRRRAGEHRPTRVAYKGMMLTGVPNFVVRVRLHQLVVDAEDRPDLRALLPAAGPHGQPWLRLRACRTRRPVDADQARCWIFGANYVQRVAGRAAAPGDRRAVVGVR